MVSALETAAGFDSSFLAFVATFSLMGAAGVAFAGFGFGVDGTSILGCAGLAVTLSSSFLDSWGSELVPDEVLFKPISGFFLVAGFFVSSEAGEVLSPGLVSTSFLGALGCIIFSMLAIIFAEFSDPPFASSSIALVNNTI